MSDQPNPQTPAPSAPATSAAPASSQSLDDILNQLEKTAGPGPSPASAPSTTEVPGEPAVATPVATLPEKEIATPTAQAPTEAAPMVTEEPGIDTGAAAVTPVEASAPPVALAAEPTPEPPAPAPIETPPPTTPIAEPPQKKSRKGAVVAGLIGVLLLAGAAGAGLFLTQQNQETRSPAAAPTAVTKIVAPEQAKASPVSTPILLTKEPISVSISGKVCPILNSKIEGNILAYNTRDKTLFVKPFSPVGGSYTLDVTSGQYLVVFVPNDATQKYGYTDDSNKLKAVSALFNDKITGIDLCDAKTDPTSVPTEKYLLYE